MATLWMIGAGCLLFGPSFGVIDMMMRGYIASNVRNKAIMDASPIHAVCSVKGCYKPATHQQQYQGYGAAEGGTFAFCDDHWPAPSDGKTLGRKGITNVGVDWIAARIVGGLCYGFMVLMFAMMFRFTPKGRKTAEEVEEARESGKMQVASVTLALAGILWIAIVVTA
jgi:hypothetical protein